VLDPFGRPVEPTVLYLKELMARDSSPLTPRAYGTDLLRWFRFLWSLGIEWDRATREEARDFMLWMKVADKPVRVHWRHRGKPPSERHLRPALEETRDPEGFARLRASVPAGTLSSVYGSSALKTIAEIMACQGGTIDDIVVGDLLLWHRMNPTNSNRRIQLAYAWLRDLGRFPADAPHTLFRISHRTGQLTPAELVDRYRLQCRPVRDLLVDYLAHRSVGLDYTSLQSLTNSLALRFWADLERHHPGVDSLRLPAEVITDWKTRLATKVVRKRLPDGSFREFTEPRRNAIAIKTQVRALYLDLAESAVEGPGRWAAWAAPCPISEAECSTKKAGQ